MRLRILAMGRLRNGPEKDLIEDYVARFSRRGRPLGLGPVELTELEDKKGGGKAAEAALLLKAIPQGAALIALDVQLKHLLGEGLGELSMAQLTELLAVQRQLTEQLEDARVSLVQRLEREIVEERMLQQFEEHLRALESRAPRSSNQD